MKLSVVLSVIAILAVVLAGCLQNTQSNTYSNNTGNEQQLLQENQEIINQTENITNVSNGSDLNDTSEMGYINDSMTPF